MSFGGLSRPRRSQRLSKKGSQTGGRFDKDHCNAVSVVKKRLSGANTCFLVDVIVLKFTDDI